MSTDERVALVATPPATEDRVADRPGAPRRRRRLSVEQVGLLGVVAMFAGIAAMYAFQQPPFYDADEKAHLAYAHELADFRLPEIETVPEVPASATQWQTERATETAARYMSIWVANHPPLHYAAVAPLIWLSDATDRADGGLLPLRLANAAFAAAGVVFTYLLAVELSGGIRRIGLAAAAIVALVPQGHVYFGRALNDGLAFAAATGLVWAGVRCLSRPDSRRDVYLLAGFAAAAAGARTATMLLALAVVGAVALHRMAAAGPSAGDRARAGLVTFGVGLGPAAALFGWFYARIQVLYGDVGASSFLLDRFYRVDRGSVLEYFTHGRLWVHLYQRMTSTAPLSWAWPRFANLAAAVIVVGIVAIVATRRTGDRADDGHRRHVSGSALALCLGAVALIFVTVAQHVSGGGSPYSRYFFPVIGVLAALAALGLDRLWPRVGPVVLIVAMAWWAIRQLPIGVDATTLERPRDDGPPPLPLQELPVGDGWRVAAATVIALGGVVAAACIAAGLVRGGRSRLRQLNDQL